MATNSFACETCGGDGCDRCDQSGNQRCEARGCGENAVAFDEDGRALCEDCLMEWQLEAFARS